MPPLTNCSLAPVPETSTIRHSTGASSGRQIARAFKSVGMRRDERFSTERPNVAGGKGVAPGVSRVRRLSQVGARSFTTFPNPAQVSTGAETGVRGH